MKAQIISIGDELLIGQVVNTNATWIGNFLMELGISVERATTIGDDEYVMKETIGGLWKEYPYTIITGGLGPTRDDRTKKVLNELFPADLAIHQPARDHITRLFSSRKLKVSADNLDQALLPVNCDPIPNENGTAFGMWFCIEGKSIISLPGVPYEMKSMFRKEIGPRLKKENTNIAPIIYRTLLTAGTTESLIAEKLRNFEDSLPKALGLAYLPAIGKVRLRLFIKPESKEKHKEALLQSQFELLREKLSDISYGTGEEKLEEVVGRELKSMNLKLGVAESCSGGFLSHLLTGIPGSSAYYQGGVVAYDNAVKVQILGVQASVLEKHGAVSEETCREMVAGIKRILDCQAGIAITGIAGPDGGSIAKPVGTVWVAASVGDQLATRCFQFGENRLATIERSAIMGLFMLLKLLRRI